MSSALAIAAVTAVLKDLLNNGLIDNEVSGHVEGNVDISARPPDRVVPSGGEEKSQLNLFLFQITPNQGWRNDRLPTRNNRGDLVANPLVAVDLTYLLTAYGAKDIHAEILLGYAMQILEENPIIPRESIRKALNPTSTLVEDTDILPTELRELLSSGLADQVEQIKVSQRFLSTEESAKMWSAIQSPMRPSLVYTITVVLMESNKKIRNSLPVIKRGSDDRGVSVGGSLSSNLPALYSLELPNVQGAVQYDDTITLKGHALDTWTQTQVRFRHRKLNTIVDKAPLTLDNEIVTVKIDGTTTDWLPGVYDVSLIGKQAADTDFRSSNVMSFALAPNILDKEWINATDGQIEIVIRCSPTVRTGQAITLSVGGTTISAEYFSGTTSLLSFLLEKPPVGNYYLTLSVDGIQSMLVGKDSQGLLVFRDDHKLVIT